MIAGRLERVADQLTDPDAGLSGQDLDTRFLEAIGVYLPVAGASTELE